VLECCWSRRGFASLPGVAAAVEEEAARRDGEEEVTAGPRGARSGHRLDRHAPCRGPSAFVSDAGADAGHREGRWVGFQ
jgi:hypothetical protein